MTSRKKPGECFVYITLPGETKAVTAGRFALAADRRGVPVGRFVYGKSYLARDAAVPLDPMELKLSERTYQTASLNGVFGALRDAGPDYWGRLIIERHLGRNNLDELTYLLESPDDRAGALGFGLGQQPPAPARKFNRTLDLEKLQEAGRRRRRRRRPGRSGNLEQVEKLLLLGTSMGGARPKAVVEDQAGLWVAKFNKPQDRWNNARVEHAMLRLAAECGLHVADSRLETVGGKDVLLVRRFDRDHTETGYRRHRMVSALTLLRTGDQPEDRAQWSYLLLADEIRRASSAPEADLRELFGRGCAAAAVAGVQKAAFARDSGRGF